MFLIGHAGDPTYVEPPSNPRNNDIFIYFAKICNEIMHDL
jgi:hypothetical protein